MCGIVGIIAKSGKTTFDHKHAEIFKDMLYVDYLRGEDSTGIYAVNKVGNVEWHKGTESPQDFLADKEASNVFKNIIWDYTAVVGHNRKATRGTVVDENAHPFVVDNIILVHNGTLLNHKDINTSVEVDSHAIAHAISEHGVETAISMLEGAFAVAAYDVVSKRLFLFRNKERPLYLAETDNAWVFASEPWMVYGMAWRHGVTLKKVAEIDPAKLHTFDLNTTETTHSEVDVKLYEKKANISFFPKGNGTDQTTTITRKKVIPFPKRGKEKKGKDSMSASSFLTTFSKDDVVCFSPKHITRQGSTYRIIGSHSKFEDIVVDVICNITYQESISLMAEETLCAFVRNIMMDSTTNTKRLHCVDPAPSIMWESINGEHVNEEILSRVTGECHQCKRLVEEEELDICYIKYTKAAQVHLVCPECVDANLAKNKRWGNILEYEATTALLQ